VIGQHGIPAILPGCVDQACHRHTLPLGLGHNLLTSEYRWSGMTASGAWRTILPPTANDPTLTLNEVMLPKSPDHVFEMLAQPMPLQRRAFELPEIDPARIVASTSPG